MSDIDGPLDEVLKIMRYAPLPMGGAVEVDRSADDDQVRAERRAHAAVDPTATLSTVGSTPGRADLGRPATRSARGRVADMAPAVLLVASIAVLLATAELAGWADLGPLLEPLRRGWWGLVVGGLLIAGAVALSRGRQRRRPAEPLRLVPLSTWTLVAAVVVVVLVGAVVTTALLAIAAAPGGTPSVRIDAIRTGLTVAAGTGGGFGLLLAFRRQRSHEITGQNEIVDSTERRVTELYGRAVDQLGSDKAPVRLGGIYALERLGQATPQQRQTIANVLCAYIRMPYEPATGAPAGPAENPVGAGAPGCGEEHPPATASEGALESSGRNREEREVRLTAQRVLAAHLRSPGSLDPVDPVDPFWPEVRDLDLTGAVLIDFDLSGCRVASARFVEARFVGDARFGDTRFVGATRFDRARFTGHASFARAEFSADVVFAETGFVDADFEGAVFAGVAAFQHSTVTASARFVEARFERALFTDAELTRAFFEGSSFGQKARFSTVSFTGGAWFSRARFDGEAEFGDARFDGVAHFDEARFGRVTFAGAGFDDDARFEGARFCGQARFHEVQFGGAVRFRDAQFVDADGRMTGAANGTVFSRARVRNAHRGRTHLPTGWKVGAADRGQRFAHEMVPTIP